MGMPHLAGVPSGSPVTLITPDIPCAIRSAGLHGVRTGLPEAGDAGVDNARVLLPMFRVVHAGASS